MTRSARAICDRLIAPLEPSPSTATAAGATPLVLVDAGVADARMWEPLLPLLTPSTSTCGRARAARRCARVAERLSRELPDARPEHIQDAGHVLALDQAAAVAQLVERHLLALTRPAPPPP